MSGENNSPLDASTRARRASFTSNTFTALFGRSNSIAGTSQGVAPQPSPINTATVPNRRVSIAAIGLSGTSPIQTSSFSFPGGGRRESVSTAGSDSIDENAIDDDEGPLSRSQPNTPFARRMSFGAQALFNARSNGSPTSGRAPSYTSHSTIPRTNGEIGHGKKPSITQASTQSQPRTTSDHSLTRSAEGLNWSEQFRSRAESAVQKPAFGSGTIPKPSIAPNHNRAKSFSDMPSPPSASIPAPAPAPQQSPLRRKPDAVGERILRGDFYMD